MAIADAEILRSLTLKVCPARSTWLVWPAVASESCVSFEERSGSRLIEIDFIFKGVVKSKLEFGELWVLFVKRCLGPGLGSLDGVFRPGVPVNPTAHQLASKIC